MFGLSEATELLQASTGRTLNCFLHYTHLIWSKITQFGKPIMPKSRKRHHSRSRSKSRSHSRDRSRDREDKHRKIESYEKDRDGKRRKLDSSDSPLQKRSVSAEPEVRLIKTTEEEEMDTVELLDNSRTTTADDISNESTISAPDEAVEELTEAGKTDEPSKNDLVDNQNQKEDTNAQSENEGNITHNEESIVEEQQIVVVLDDSGETNNPKAIELTPSKVKKKLQITPKKVLSPKQLQKKLESAKKREEKQREKEEKEKKRNEERELLNQEKIKKKEEKLKELEQKQKEKELKEAQKREEREKKEEQKRKEREEKEQKRREKEEKDEEKNKEKQKEEEKKQKAAAAFANFFVSKKSDNVQEKKCEDATPSLFMAFEIKSDMRLPPSRRSPLSSEELNNLDICLKQQSESANYLKELKTGKVIGTCSKTWPYQETLDDKDVVIVEEDLNLGETICGDDSKLQKFRAKFLKFHENRRPAYYGTWRKQSKSISARKPFGEDKIFNYEEDSDDDWEEEEQGESLNGSDDEDKENDEERDEYEVDNEFFVPHGHLSDDEIDDEENAKLSPESLKEKLKLLKDEFDQDMQSKTHRLKSRSIGCIWYNKDGSNVDEAINRYLQPLAVIVNEPIQIKNRNELLLLAAVRKNKPTKELNSEYIPQFLKVIHGNTNKKIVIVEQFLTLMGNKGINVDLKKGTLIKILKRYASWKPSKEKGNAKNKYCWLVNEEIEKQFNPDLVLPNFLESDTKK